MISKTLFNLVHKNTLIYNCCWEDPRIDRQLMNIHPNSIIAMITSAGCNALSYLLDDPKEIHCIDVNPRQNALLELKLAALKLLPFSDFFAIFGKGSHPEFHTIYHDLLRGQLSESARQIWDVKSYYFYTEPNGNSLYYHGSSGFFAKQLVRYLKRKPTIYEEILLLLDAPTLSEQKKHYQAVKPHLWNGLTKLLMNSEVTLSLLGIPKSQKRMIQSDYDGKLYHFIDEVFTHLFEELSTTDNYFWRAYLTGSYTPQCCPDYLKEENFSVLKDRADRIHFHTTIFSSFLETHKNVIDHYVLLDHQDWLSDNNREELDHEWSLMFEFSHDKTEFLLRSASKTRDFLPEFVLNTIDWQDSLVSERSYFDRVGTYASTHFGYRKK